MLVLIINNNNKSMLKESKLFS